MCDHFDQNLYEMAVIHLSPIREESDCNSVLENHERVADLECLVVLIDPTSPLAPPRPQLYSVLQNATNLREFRLAGAEEGPTTPVFSRIMNNLWCVPSRSMEIPS